MKAWHHSVYTATSAGAISTHLSGKHLIRDPEKDSKAQSSTLLQAGSEQGKLSHCFECGHCNGVNEDFDGYLYKQRYIDWTIRHNIAFYTATYPDTLALL